MLSDKHSLYWGDAHTNLRPHQIDRWPEAFQAAREVLDFWPVAYYPFLLEEVAGLTLESSGNRTECLKQWETLCTLTAEHNEQGRFVCFPGYEWHGDRRLWGDHNVFYKNESYPLDDTKRLDRLYAHLRDREAIAIPHHTAYATGWRGKDWSVFDEGLSPFVEIFSTHGSSEGYLGPLPLERNVAMGPLVQAGSVQAGLERGLHFGLIASGDLHHGYPTQWGTGLMACYAASLTRDALWKAFLARQVYAVTGDRIRLDVEAAGLNMGAVGRARPPYRLKVWTEGSDTLARIELVRNNRVVRCTCFSAFDMPLPVSQERYKLRSVFGWGPMPSRHREPVPDRQWDVELDVEGGRLLEIEPMWNDFGQRILERAETGARFRLHTGPGTWSLHCTPRFQGLGFEIEGSGSTRLHFRINGKPFAFSLEQSRTFPTVMADIDSGINFLDRRYGITPRFLEEHRLGRNAVYADSYKAQFWPAVHETEFRAELEWEDDPERAEESWYYVRVVQQNGQMAWSSPVWLTPVV